MSLHQYTVIDINGKNFSMDSLRGKKVMLVNTASACGLTPQYAQLEELYQSTNREEFEIIGFPCNDFGAQEPGSETEIAEFCQKNYGVSFPMMSKISVKGEATHAVYKWLLNQSAANGGLDHVKWNFQKFLVNSDGTFHQTIEPILEPLHPEIVNWIHGK
jgi:glutathione peroxidase